MKAVISQSFFSRGVRQGLPCVVVDFINIKDANDLEMNDIVTEILEYKGKVDYIQVIAVLKDSGDAVSLVRILTETNFKVVVSTNTTDDVTSLVYNKRINFSVNFVQPDSVGNHFNHASLNALRENDEIIVEEKDKTVIDFAVKAIREKCFTKPDIIFSIPKESNKIVMAKKFTCNIRVIN